MENIVAVVSENNVPQLKKIVENLRKCNVNLIITTKIIFNITTISKNIKTDSTERINKLIRKRIEKNNKILQKRILHAFPKLKFLSIKIKRKRK